MAGQRAPAAGHCLKNAKFTANERYPEKTVESAPPVAAVLSASPISIRIGLNRNWSKFSVGGFHDFRLQPRPVLPTNGMQTMIRNSVECLQLFEMEHSPRDLPGFNFGCKEDCRGKGKGQIAS
ncbi:hypothetical protein K0M31_004569 [Melipona bicolor]|uniref:Uncharacterized protein n=1 Tax=Melipona bicolor TaxID=60889 RepID=A0AA40FXC4_9HYME|nr:hypothetical protein K0M31_004569 [Melipona bicolor]